MNILAVPLTRRQAFKALLGLGGTAAGAVLPRSAAGFTEEHPAHPVAPATAVAMLYDSIICTGCKACTPACNEANGLPADTLLSGGIWDMPTGLNAQTKNIIELYQDPRSDEFVFVKKQCMHYLDPACLTGCPSPRFNGSGERQGCSSKKDEYEPGNGSRLRLRQTFSRYLAQGTRCG